MEQEGEPKAIRFDSNNANKKASAEDNQQQGIKCEKTDEEFKIDLKRKLSLFEAGKEYSKALRNQTDLGEEDLKDCKLGSASFEAGKEKDIESMQNLKDVRQERMSDIHTTEEIQTIIDKLSRSLEKDKDMEKFIALWMSCCDCNKMFESYILLKEHLKVTHNDKLNIKCCAKKIDKSSDLLKHIRLHSSPDKYKCDICGKYRENLLAHKNGMHKELLKNFKCSVCGKKFNEKLCLERHITCHTNVTKDFICEKCGMGYVLECQLSLHMKAKHHVCDHCGETFISTFDLKKHLLEQTGNETIKFPCTKCDAQLASLKDVNRHEAAIHNDGVSYVCTICGKDIKSKIYLIRHRKKVHKLVGRLKCTHCDRVFRWRKEQREHIASHTGEALYQCPHCPEKFQRMSRNHRHLREVHPVEFVEFKNNRLKLRKAKENRKANAM